MSYDSFGGGTTGLPSIPRDSGAAATTPALPTPPSLMTSKMQRKIGSRSLIRGADKIQAAADRRGANEVRYEHIVEGMSQRIQPRGAVLADAGPRARCGCLARKANEQFGPLDPGMIQALEESCVAGESVAFSEAAKQGVKVDSCRAWYMRRKVWMLGGVAAGAFVLLKVLK